VVRPHGLGGAAVVELVSNRSERVRPGAVLRGPDGRTYRVATSQPVPGARSRSRYLVRFEGVGDRRGAEALRGVRLLAEPLEDPGAWWVHQLIGARVTSCAGAHLGTVVALEENPASDLLVLDGGGLVPLRFVVERGDGWLRVDVPTGLLER
jgi:16S rRNA processing protein RimM